VTVVDHAKTYWYSFEHDAPEGPFESERDARLAMLDDPRFDLDRPWRVSSRTGSRPLEAVMDYPGR